MSQDSNISKKLRIFYTAPHACSYLPGQESTTAFIDPDAAIDNATYTYLSERGYRRSGNYMYKPDCFRCSACISLRVPVNKHVFSRSDKRVFKRNSDLSVEIVPDIQADHYYQLYADYINQRHADGDMYPPNYQQYSDFLNNAYGNTRYAVFKNQQEQIKAVAVIDQLENGLSAVYTFYDPLEEKRGLGILAVLWQIQQAQQLGLDYVYLGYWIKQCAKMSYKTRFRPAEILINQRWLTLL